MSYYVAEQNTGGVYVSGVTKNPPAINYSSNIEEAEWSTDSAKVTQLITRNNIPNVSATVKSGDHPGTKPPIP